MTKNTNRGITLIALVITIVVTIFLSGIVIGSALNGENGLITVAKKSADNYDEKEKEDAKDRRDVVEKLQQDDAGVVVDDNIKPDVTFQKFQGIISQEGTANKNMIVSDEDENLFFVPEGFKLANDSGHSVADGIIIEDVNNGHEGAQFVWIPIGEITVKLQNGTEKVNTQEAFGRYYDGQIKQLASSWADSVTLVEDTNPKYIEYSMRTENVANAKNLKKFYESTIKNKGFYVSRYVARRDTNSEFNEVGNLLYYGKLDELESSERDKIYTLPGLIKDLLTSNVKLNGNGNYFNYINQNQASQLSQDLYNTSSEFESDLINSFAYDTINHIILNSSTNQKYSVFSNLANKIADWNYSNYVTWTTENAENTENQDEKYVGRANQGNRGTYKKIDNLPEVQIIEKPSDEGIEYPEKNEMINIIIEKYFDKIFGKDSEFHTNKEKFDELCGIAFYIVDALSEKDDYKKYVEGDNVDFENLDESQIIPMCFGKKSPYSYFLDEEKGPGVYDGITKEIDTENNQIRLTDSDKGITMTVYNYNKDTREINALIINEKTGENTIVVREYLDDGSLNANLNYVTIKGNDDINSRKFKI